MRILTLAALAAALFLGGLTPALADDVIEVIEIEEVQPTAVAVPVAPVEPVMPVRTVRPAMVAPCTPAPRLSPCATPCPTPCAPRPTWVPPRREMRCRTVAVPAVTHTYYVPVYEDVEVPVYKLVCKPIYRETEWPDMVQRCVPVMGKRKVKVYEDVTVPTYATKTVPLTKEVCDKCTGKKRIVPNGCKRILIKTGEETSSCFKGYRWETYQEGTKNIWVKRGMCRKTVQCGTKVERVKVCVRMEKRFKGYRCETIQLKAASQKTVNECVTIPGYCQPAR